MNLGELKARARTLLGDETGVVITEEDLTRWANDAQLDIVRKTGCLEDFISFDLEAGTESYDLPNDFLKDRRLTVNNLKVNRTSLEELDNINPDRDATAVADTATAFYIYGRKIYLYPTPASSATDGLKLWYTYIPRTMVADIDTPVIPVSMHEDILTYVVSQGYQSNEDYGPAQLKMNEYGERIVFSTEEYNDPRKDSYPAVRALPGDY